MSTMALVQLLAERRALITERWLHLIFQTYPPETARFLKKEKNRFDNPLGYRISQGVKGLVEALLTETGASEFIAHLDEIIRIQALQDYSPAQALAFIFLLKNVIREELGDTLKDAVLAVECLELESRIDGMALLGFEVYTKRREKLHEVRLNEVKKRVSGLLRRSGLSPASLEPEAESIG
jgi:hypothetical protein